MKRTNLKSLRALLVLSFFIINVNIGKSQSAQTKLTEEEINALPLIETHCHVRHSGKGSFENLKALQDDENISYALMLSKQVDKVIECCKKHPEETGALLWINPKEKVDYEKLEKSISENLEVVKGIKLHPNVDHYIVSKQILDSIFILANKFDLLIASHTSDTDWSRARLFKPLMEKYPDTKFILYHATPLEDCIEIVNKYPNVYIDLSYTAWGKEFQQKALAAIGKEKIVFGIDSPLGFKSENDKFLPHYREAAVEVAGFYDFDRDVVEHVFYKNAASLLGVDVK